MDRVPNLPQFVAQAIGLVGAPACACDQRGLIIAVNPELIELLGADITGTSVGLYCAALAEQTERAESRVWEDEVQLGARTVAVRVRAKPLPPYAGVAGMSFTFGDLRAFQTDQAALRQSLLSQQAILENAAVGILYSREHLIVECNIRAAEILGYSQDAIIGMDSVAVYPSEQAYADLRRESAHLLSAGQSYSTELQLKRRDGRLLWCRLYGRAIDPDDTSHGTIWILEDIDVQYNNEVKLRRTVLEMEAIMDNAPLAIGFERDGCIVRHNQRFAEFFGFAADSGAGRATASLFTSGAAFAQADGEMAPLLSAGQTYQAEMELRRDDGSTFWAYAYIYAINTGRAQQDTIWILDDRSSQRAADASTRQLLLEQKAILDNASVGILFTRGGLMASCNPRLADMLGYAREEMTGLEAVSVFPSPEAHHAFARESEPFLAAGQLFEKAEARFMRRDGVLIWCRVRAQALDPENRERGTIWILEDVTEARQTLVEVQAIMTNASVSILFTKNRLITRYNRGFGDMFRYEGDEALGLPGRALYPSDDVYDQVGKGAFPLLSVGKPFQTEVHMARKDGSLIWAQLIAYVVNPDDPAAGTIWIIEDRTEHKLAEESLRNALLENQAILDSAVLGIAVVEQGKNLRCNTKMEELFGYAPGEIVGLPVSALYPDKSGWEEARSETRRNFSEGRVSMSEFQLVRKDGSTFWARLSGRPFDLAQPFGRSVWLVDDVTARREAAETVRRARDELEVRVLERTAELAGANALLQGEIAERRQAEARVHHMAYHDTLTGLPNRALLADRLDRAMLAVQRSERKLAVMFLDLDRFKTINDSLGHLTGDHLLREVASRLCRAVRASDTVARLGGDEFVVLVPGIRGADECTHVAQKIIDALSDPFPFEGRLLHITPSIGICLYPDDGADVETLMRHADAAMYHAKASGRNNYQFFTQRMNQAAAQHFEIESSLRSALARGEFELFYQPIMDLPTRRVHTMEVLLRWRRPNAGLILPDHFIPILEDNGLIVPVGEWVIRQACEQIVAWKSAGMVAVPLAVNLSPRQFMHRGLVDSIRSILDETGIDPALLEFEITETALMQHGEHTLEILGQISAMGIRMSIDDFGTGYSSLAYLKRFPVKKIKIDRAFIRELEVSSEDRAIVAAIMALANSLQLKVVAEGVETEGQLALLEAEGCQYVQGYLFSQPVELIEARSLLA